MMKKILISFIALFIVLTCSAKTQVNGYKSFYREYRDAPNTITFKIPGGLASMFMQNEDDDVKEFMKNMDDISFFIADNATDQMLIDLNKYLPEREYKEIMIIRDGGSEVIFLAKENGDVIEEILMTVVDKNDLVVMCIFGEFTKDDAKRIAKSIKTDAAISFRN